MLTVELEKIQRSGFVARMFSLEGHTALITGGTRGIGRGVADEVAAAGANIVIVGTKQEAAGHAAEEIRAAHGVKTAAYACDVADADQVREAFERCAKEFILPDLLLNNAGITIHKEALEVTDEEWRRVMDINLSGAFYCSRALARLLVDAGKGGSIVNLASNACQMVPTPQPQASYNASKAGMVMLSRSLAIEWAKYGIRVNTVSPGYVATDMTVHVRPDWFEQWIKSIPAGRMGTPSEIASAVIYLFSDASAFSVGSNVIIDGGAHCI